MEEKSLCLFSKGDIVDCVKQALSESLEETGLLKLRQDEYFTRQDTADYLNITLPTLDSLRVRGVIKAYRIGHRVLYKKSEVDSAVKEIKY